MVHCPSAFLMVAAPICWNTSSHSSARSAFILHARYIDASHLDRRTVGLIARECLTEGAVVGQAGADAVAIFDHGCARTVTGRRPRHLVATRMASAVAARYLRSRRGANRESASYPA